MWDTHALIRRRRIRATRAARTRSATTASLESFEDASLIEVRLQTGKRNQIRLQARLRGHTLVGEQRYTYGPDSLRPIAFRPAGAARLPAGVSPPRGRPAAAFEAPLPADFDALLERLRRG